jgi:hypothetical protein
MEIENIMTEQVFFQFKKKSLLKVQNVFFYKDELSFDQSTVSNDDRYSTGAILELI